MEGTHKERGIESDRDREKIKRDRKKDRAKDRQIDRGRERLRMGERGMYRWTERRGRETTEVPEEGARGEQRERKKSAATTKFVRSSNGAFMVCAE